MAATLNNKTNDNYETNSLMKKIPAEEGSWLGDTFRLKKRRNPPKKELVTK